MGRMDVCVAEPTSLHLDPNLSRFKRTRADSLHNERLVEAVHHLSLVSLGNRWGHLGIFSCKCHFQSS